MPGNVLNNSSVSCEDSLSVNDLVLLGGGVDVPEADGVVVTGREEMSVEVGVPREAVALLLMTSQPQVGLALATWIRLARVFGVIKHEDIAAGSLGGDDAGVLGHVPGPVHLPLVVDLDLNLKLARDRAKPSKLSLLIVIMGGVKLGVLVGELHAGNQQVVLLVARVRSKDQPFT